MTRIKDKFKKDGKMKNLIILLLVIISINFSVSAKEPPAPDLILYKGRR